MPERRKYRLSEVTLTDKKGVQTDYPHLETATDVYPSGTIGEVDETNGSETAFWIPDPLEPDGEGKYIFISHDRGEPIE